MANKLSAVLATSTGGQNRTDTYKITNKSSATVKLPGVVDSASVVDADLLIVVKGLDSKITLTNASGTTKAGDPYLRVFLTNGVLQAGESTTQTLQFHRGAGAPAVKYQLDFLSGQGNP